MVFSLELKLWNKLEGGTLTIGLIIFEVIEEDLLLAGVDFLIFSGLGSLSETSFTVSTMEAGILDTLTVVLLLTFKPYGFNWDCCGAVGWEVSELPNKLFTVAGLLLKRLLLPVKLLPLKVFVLELPNKEEPVVEPMVLVFDKEELPNSPPVVAPVVVEAVGLEPNSPPEICLVDVLWPNNPPDDGKVVGLLATVEFPNNPPVGVFEMAALDVVVPNRPLGLFWKVLLLPNNPPPKEVVVCVVGLFPNNPVDGLGVEVPNDVVLLTLLNNPLGFCVNNEVLLPVGAGAGVEKGVELLSLVLNI